MMKSVRSSEILRKKLARATSAAAPFETAEWEPGSANRIENFVVQRALDMYAVVCTPGASPPLFAIRSVSAMYGVSAQTCECAAHTAR